MFSPEERAAFKSVLAQVGEVLGREGGDRVVVLRCARAEQVSVVASLLPKAYPKIRWQAVDAHSGNLAQLLSLAIRLALEPQEPKVSLIHSLPGEPAERSVTPEAARALEEAMPQGLAQAPMILAIASGSVPVLAREAPTFWQRKGGYFAWPSPAASGDEGRPTAQPGPAKLSDDVKLDGAEQEYVGSILKGLKGKEAADYLLQVARKHLEGGDSEHARLFLLRSLQIQAEFGNLDQMVSCYYLLGLGAQQAGDQETAIEWYNQAIDNLRILADQRRLGELIGQKGYAHYLLGHYEPAVKAFNEALDIDQANGDRNREAAGLRKIAMVLELMKRFGAAEELCNRSLAIEQELGNSAGMARVLHQLGRLAEGQEQRDKALDFYQQSLTLKESINDRAGLASTHHQLGNLHLMAEEREDAIECYRRALELEEETGDRQGVARTRAQLGIALRDLGRVEEALSELMSAYHILQALRSPLAAEVLGKVDELQDLVPAEVFNRILREASVATKA